jgi:hypothetical protein
MKFHHDAAAVRRLADSELDQVAGATKQSVARIVSDIVGEIGIMYGNDLLDHHKMGSLIGDKKIRSM